MWGCLRLLLRLQHAAPSRQLRGRTDSENAQNWKGQKPSSDWLQQCKTNLIRDSTVSGIDLISGVVGSRSSKVGHGMSVFSSMFWFFFPLVGSIFKQPPYVVAAVGVYAPNFKSVRERQRERESPFNSSSNSPGLSFTVTWVTGPVQSTGPGQGNEVLRRALLDPPLTPIYSHQDLRGHQQVLIKSGILFKAQLWEQESLAPCILHGFPRQIQASASPNPGCYQWMAG